MKMGSCEMAADVQSTRLFFVKFGEVSLPVLERDLCVLALNAKFSVGTKIKY